MSKLWKGVKKVFKKVVKFVKKYWVYIAIAVAVYFTAGVALAAMPSTATFSAAMPGFGVGGMFSNAAVAMGATGAAGSGIAGTVAANAAAAAAAGAATTAALPGMSAAAGGSGLGLGTSTGAVSAQAAGMMPGAVTAGTTGATAAGGTAAGSMGGAVAGTAAAATKAAAAGGVISKTSAAVKGMSGLEKVALASTVFKGVGGLLSDSDDDINRKQHAREYGQSYGIGRDGTGPGYTGLVKEAFGDKYGGTAGTQGQQAETPFDQQSQAQSEGGGGGTPFDDGNQLAQQNAPKREYVNTGYRNRNYSPI